MAKYKKRSGGAFLAGVVVTLIAALGIGELGIGNFEGGIVTDIFTKEEQIVTEDVTEGLYDAEIMVVGDIISLNGEEVTIDELKAQMADYADKKVLLIDGGATHAAWQEVVDALNELDCIVETQ